MIADIGGRTHDIGQLGDKAQPAHLVEHIGFPQFFGQGYEVHGFIIILQAHHGLIDNTVGFPIEIIRLQDFLHLDDGFFFDEHSP